MRFIGQFHIMNQLKFLLPNLYETGRGANFLLRGPSGYGKTTLALSICNYLANGKNFELYWADFTEFRFQKKVIFVDEIHRVKDLENLYGVMDSKEHVMVFATNQDANLPEAFVNRCWEYVFDEYSNDELVLIAMESSEFSTTEENYLAIVDAGNKNPRVIKSLVDRIGKYLQHNKLDPKTANFQQILEEVFQIKDGLNTLCRRYLEVLEEVGGTASISLLKNVLHVPDGTLIHEVEPVLIRKGLVKITKKGRVLC